MYEICVDSIDKLVFNKIIKTPSSMPAPSLTQTFDYYECSVKVINEHDRVVVAEERFQCPSALGDLVSLKAIALSPVRDKEYMDRRQAHFKRAQGCLKKGCFACSNIEYSSSVFLNEDIGTKDEYYIPLGFRVSDDNHVEALAVPLHVLATDHSTLKRVSYPVEVNPVVVKMSRFRGTCKLVPLNGGEVYIAERFRGRLS